MKKIISLLVVMALSFASVTAFAAPAVVTDNINVKLVADKATVAPGESFTLSAYISANGNADVSFDTVAMFGMIFDFDNFDWEVKNPGTFDVQDMIADYGCVWAMDETSMSYAANTACVELTITAKDTADEKSYDFTLSDVDEDTGFQQGQLTPFMPSNGNVTLIGTSVEVKAAEEEGTSTKTVYAEETYALSKETFDFGSAYDFTKKYNVVVKYNNAETKIYGWSWKNNLGIDGDGEVTGKVKFGVKVTNPSAYDATLFTFELDEVE